MKNLKTLSPKMTGKSGFKNTEHGPGWISAIVGAISAGTSAAVKAFRNPISYHGQPPHWQQSDLIAPIEARPSSEISEPVDLPDADDTGRKIDPNANVPIHPAMRR